MSRRALAFDTRGAFALGVLAFVLLPLAGCMPKMTVQQMRDEMPKRPAELDKLQPFVGTWRSEGTANFAFLDQPLKMTGESTTVWGPDRWYLIMDEKGDMQDIGPMHSHGAWTYDARTKKYPMSFVNTMGMLEMGQCWLDAKTDTWHFVGTSEGKWGKSTMRGTVKFPDANTQEWYMTEHMGLTKIMDMRATAKRVSGAGAR